MGITSVTIFFGFLHIYAKKTSVTKWHMIYSDIYEVNLTAFQLCAIMLQPNHTFFSEITNKMFIKVFVKYE